MQTGILKSPIAEFDSGTLPGEFLIFKDLLEAVFTVAYVQGKYDAINGFNTCASNASVASAWLDENADLLSLPVDIAELLRRLRDEALKMSG